MIDASVASSASEKPEIVPQSCRDFLVGVLEICHRLVLSPALSAEWGRHQSRYASTWRASMVARKKVAFLRESPADPELTAAILATADTDAARQALAKDVLLVEAALATDSIVVSRDAEVRALFRHASRRVGRLRDVVWVDPVRDEGVLEWLRGERPRLAESWRLALPGDGR